MQPKSESLFTQLLMNSAETTAQIKDIVLIVFLIFSLFQFDREVSDVKGQILLTVVFVMPFMVLIGLGIGGLWSKFY